MLEILQEFCDIYCENYYEGPEGSELIQETEWSQDHKYQYKQEVYKYHDLLIEVQLSRSGSYHTNWYYNAPDFYVVEPEEIVIKKIVYNHIKDGDKAITVTGKERY